MKKWQNLGMRFTFVEASADTGKITIDGNGADTITTPSVAATADIVAAARGDTITLVAISTTEWYATTDGSGWT